MLGKKSTAREALCSGSTVPSEAPMPMNPGERSLATLEETQRVAANTEALGQ